MLGKMLGNLVSLPVRVVSIPAKAAKATFEFMAGEDFEPQKERTFVDDIADTIEGTIKSAIDD